MYVRHSRPKWGSAELAHIRPKRNAPLNFGFSAQLGEEPKVELALA